MNELRVAGRAARDIDEILERSEADFGAVAADRYRRLLDVALQLLKSDPARAGVRTDADLPSGVRLFHLRIARNRLAAVDRVGRPRHFLVFRIRPGLIEVLRVLHDTMDLARHL